MLAAPSGDSKLIRVVIIDDHPSTLRGIALILEDAGDIQVVNTYVRIEKAIAAVNQDRPDIVLMDIEIKGGGMQGIEGTRLLLAAYPEARVVMCSNWTDRQRVEQALAAGATSYLDKGSKDDEIILAVRATAKGGRHISSGPLSNLGDIQSALRLGSVRLTEEERKVVILVAQGLMNKEIATRLGIAPQTVKNTITALNRRLFDAPFNPRYKLIKWAEAHGLADPSCQP